MSSTRIIEAVRKNPKIVLFAISMVCLSAFFYHYAASYYRGYIHMVQENSAEHMRLTAKGVEIANKQLENAEAPINALVESSLFRDMNSSSEQLLVALQKVIEKEPLYSMGGIAFNPTVLGKERHAFYLLGKEQQGKRRDIAEETDYTRFDWYTLGAHHSGGWIAQIYDPVEAAYVLRLVRPFSGNDPQTGKNVVRGVVFVDIDRTVFMEGINELDLGSLSYAFLVTNKGTLITYPIQSYIDEYHTLDNVSQIPGKLGLKELANMVKQHETDKVHMVFDDLARETYYVSFASLKQNPDWYFMLFSQKPILIFKPAIRKTLTYIGLLALFAVLLIIWFISFIFPSRHRWALVSTLVSCAYVLMMVFQLYIGVKGQERPAESHMVLGKVDLQRFINFISRRNERLNNAPLIFVPTGVWLEYIAQDGERIQANGILWQKYNALRNKDLAKSFGIANVQKLELEKLYEDVKNDMTIIGWRFKALLNTEFNYLMYPFDTQVIRFKLTHPNFDENIVLVPDFDSYASTEIGKKIGIEKVYSTSAWQIKRSYFSYNIEENGTDFGLISSVKKRDFPNLYYNVVVTRNLMSALIGYMLPVFILVAILFYGFIQSATSKIDLTTSIARASGLFLATIFAHQSLRKNFSDLSGINYLEYFYFITYFMIVVVLNFDLCAYWLRVKNKHIRLEPFIYFYWPVFTSILLIVTLYFFF